jgi:fructosamine-3-kinase
MVLRSVLHSGFSSLFTDSEIQICETYEALSPQAQTIFARLLPRKRVWYAAHHIKQYTADYEQAVKELVDKGLL